mgnify:CR=1 FL=1
MGAISNPVGDVGFRRIVKFEYTGAAAEYAKPPGLRRVKVRVVGGGGNTPPVTGPENSSGGAGGGGYTEKVIEAKDLSPVELVNVGGPGMLSTFGAHCSATGGSAPVGNEGGIGGVGIGGDFDVRGGAGGAPVFFMDSSGNKIIVSGGMGGDSLLSGRPKQRVAHVDGHPGHTYGGGASAAFVRSSMTLSGAAGANGVVVVEEFY